jgi:hypothetical protein
LWSLLSPLFLARRVLEQERRQRGRKVYSLHAPEAGCIGDGPERSAKVFRKLIARCSVS